MFEAPTKGFHCAGETDFAANQWAGIELDDPVGKNDGSVAGKRYFDCKMKYGLFAPLHKISAAPLSALSRSKRSSTSGLASSKASSINRLVPGSSSAMSRADSQESVSSVASSVASSTRHSRIRLGVTSLKSPTSQASPGGTGLGAYHSNKQAIAGTNAAILDALKEKDEHIAQLLRERDLERGEFSRVAVHTKELEESIAQLQQENVRIANEAEEEIHELKRLNGEYEEVQLKLTTQLDEHRSKLEDLQFRLEEETLMKADLETEVADIKKQLECQASQLNQVSAGEQAVAINGSADGGLATVVVEAKENELFALREEMTRKDELIFQMEASAELRKTELNSAQTRLKEVEQVSLVHAPYSDLLTNIQSN